MNRKYVIYIRVSTQKQGKSMLGLESQTEICNNFIKSNNGTCLKTFCDVESGTKRDRKELLAAIEYCKSNNCTLVIAKLDRLARDVEFTFKVINTGIDIHFVDMPNVNTMILGVFASVAQYERELCSSRTKAALQAKRDRGECLGRASDKYKIDDENQQAGIIKSAKKRCENNICSADFIALCRILKRVYAPLNDVSTQDELFMLKWCDVKDEVLKSLTRDNLFVVMQNMVEANQYNNTLFTKYDFSNVDYMLKLLKSKIYTVFRSISTYNLYNGN